MVMISSAMDNSSQKISDVTCMFGAPVGGVPDRKRQHDQMTAQILFCVCSSLAAIL